ncbi:MAG: nucleotide exchange factor GrpE [Methylovulum sp.]|uniref:nucleotide exchange factor GrpE n=1 Tax=Methylovulum sp. TaxID=1916980 RepID=UPI00261846C8|nr:nucleotide exchange factor GrpE [Methylovulum sp.]MDD2724828.1 nucleotide exchange factor GrpE [Methylovulum sp.]MDD5124074.1 nucleotide exchange factor GrpE [Methylovulum sp.]
MSNEQEKPESPVDADVETGAQTGQETVIDQDTTETVADTEIGEHEYTIDELKKELAEAKQKAHENWDKAVRTQAEMENLKRRTQKDLEDAHKFALTGFAKELLPVLDSLELGLQAATGDNDEVKKFREGSELTIKQFEAAFARFNVVTINPVGEPFNAEHHQAMVMQAVEGAVPNTVVTVFQKGYLLNGRLLRPAMVVVAKAAD